MLSSLAAHTSNDSLQICCSLPFEHRFNLQTTQNKEARYSRDQSHVEISCAAAEALEALSITASCVAKKCH